ncbi:dihydrofolate reductase family protein [Lacticaseibacillus pabuli]|uniref:Dihydrofolate reductase family protein n=1 Tax=Lacticaseibacillus pabuli TaxID=3025672 RepID=A0ABY7WWF0_9LACO|nr:dihydrofolate reductase family protein [Lacticaseibacillus sp. KACC 23028]WDF83465.1 dihydrofolate reductase family protein [Lacticaseibacillus sp. KACC 23028]
MTGWVGTAPADDGYAGFAKTIDSVVMGYSTYHQVVTALSPETWPYAGMQSFVLTHHKPAPVQNVQFRHEAVTELIRSLRQKAGKAIWILGGASIVTPLVEANMIDEYHLTIMPILLGKGIRLFQDQATRIPLRLVSSSSHQGIIDCVYHRR